MSKVVKNFTSYLTKRVGSAIIVAVNLMVFKLINNLIIPFHGPTEKALAAR